MNYSKELREFINTGLNIRKVAIASGVDNYVNYYDIVINERNFNNVCEFIDTYTCDLSENYLNNIVDILFSLIAKKEINYSDFKTNTDKIEKVLNTISL